MDITIILVIIIIMIIFFVGYIIYNRNKKLNSIEINDNCLYKRFGCCNDKLTPKLDEDGSNCKFY